LVGSVHAIKKNTEALVIVRNDNGLEANADKTKYLVLAGDQNAGRSHNMKIDNNSCIRVEEFKDLGTN
jgi:hypothetical protein